MNNPNIFEKIYNNSLRVPSNDYVNYFTILRHISSDLWMNSINILPHGQKKSRKIVLENPEQRNQPFQIISTISTKKQKC